MDLEIDNLGHLFDSAHMGWSFKLWIVWFDFAHDTPVEPASSGLGQELYSRSRDDGEDERLDRCGRATTSAGLSRIAVVTGKCPLLCAYSGADCCLHIFANLIPYVQPVCSIPWSAAISLLFMWSSQ